MTTSPAIRLVIVAVAIAAPATARAALIVQAPAVALDSGQTTHGMVIIDNTGTGAVEILDFVPVPAMCPDADRFGLPRPVPHTIAGMGTFTFDVGFGPFVAGGTQSCRLTVITDAGSGPQFTLTANVTPVVSGGSGVTVDPDGLAFGATAPGAVKDRVIAQISQDPGGSTNSPTFMFSGGDMAMFQMVSPCSAAPGMMCQGGTLGPGVVINNAQVRCAPAGGTGSGWYETSLVVRGWMTMFDSIKLTCDVRGTGTGPPPDAAPGTPDADPLAPDADPFAPDADPFAPDARPGGNPGTGDGVTDYYACGCDGGTGASGFLIVLVVFATARRAR